ncbi:MAG: cytochrome c peroxidase [Myxococcaceae bacterium]
MLTFVSACGGPPDGFTDEEWKTVQTMSPLPALPTDTTNKYADNELAAEFGHKMFFDPGYSGAIVTADDGTNGGLGAVGETGKVSCYSCHQPNYEWADNRSKPNNVPLGANYNTRNAPSMLNSAYYDWYTWAGRLDSNWAQGATAPESGDLASNRCHVAHFIFDKYKADYNAIFDDKLPESLDANATDAARFPSACKPKAAGAADGPWEMMTADDRTAILRVMSNLGKAFAAYERKLVSGNSPFDKYVAGDHSAISASAKRGLKLFVGTAFCVQCHAGAIFSDQKFHNLGVPQMGPNVPATDNGRAQDIPKLLANPYIGTSAFSDDTAAGHKKLDPVMPDATLTGCFRTKNLRGVAGTAPYYHDGVFATLDDVVNFYSMGGGTSATGGTKDEKIKALNLTDDQKKDLVEFLKTLTGETPDAKWGLITP